MTGERRLRARRGGAPDVIVAGAGMAGLVAAAEARAAGARVELLEKLPEPGGSMRLSSGVVWRHRDFGAFRAECPSGDERLQRLVFDRLDGDLAWLESLGVRVAERGTGNPRTTGARLDTASLVEALVRAGAEPRLATPLRELPASAPVVLATGGFQASPELVRRHVTAEPAMLRAAPGSTGDGLRLGRAAGAERAGGLGEAYVRNMPAPPARVGPGDFVRLSQMYARWATVTNARGEEFATRTWSEVDVGQWTARQPGARAWYRVEAAALGERFRERTVGGMVDAAEAAGAPVRRERGGAVVVETIAGLTTTFGGLRVDERACAAPGVFACGADVGGIASGGYASGLAAALVLGRIAGRGAAEAA
jgi:fumarate reductase flavoprotein subunit